MKKFIIVLLVLLPFAMKAQNTGVDFQHNLSWKEIQAKAKAENKYIFMDCFTTWCGPCKYMSATIFPLQNVGEFMNDKFISVKVQLDTTAGDNAAVKAWYKDGHDIAKEYNVLAYPTYLVFDAKGNIVHRFVGSSPADEFLAAVKKSLDPETQYYTLLNQYKAGKKDEAFLRKVALASADSYDMENAKKIGGEYLATQSDLYTNENLGFIQKFTETSKDKGFELMLKNPEKVDAILGEGAAAAAIQPIIMREEVYKNFPQDPKSPVDWDNMNTELTRKYPAQAGEVLGKAKVIWYQHAGDWNNYQIAIVDYMNKYGAKASPNELNSYAWTVFQNCPDMKCVTQALDWSKRSFKDEENPAFLDTYANILYKLGKKDEALTWEKKAMDLSPDTDKKSYQDTIDKMAKDEKTWN
ncbi:MAG: thioredoxin fold domain-containing protein [Ginsengibacter sp.]